MSKTRQIEISSLAVPGWDVACAKIPTNQCWTNGVFDSSLLEFSPLVPCNFQKFLNFQLPAQSWRKAMAGLNFSFLGNTKEISVLWKVLHILEIKSINNLLKKTNILTMDVWSLTRSKVVCSFFWLWKPLCYTEETQLWKLHCNEVLRPISYPLSNIFPAQRSQSFDKYLLSIYSVQSTVYCGKQEKRRLLPSLRIHSTMGISCVKI